MTAHTTDTALPRLRRYARLASIFFGASVAAKLEYRVNFFMNTIEAAMRGVGLVFGLGVLFADGALGGWNIHEAYVLVGVFTLIEGIMGMIAYPNLRRISEAVRTGSMDFILLKPIDAQFTSSLREIDVFRVVDVLVGLGFLTYGMAHLPNITAGGLTVAFFLLVASCAMFYALCFMLATTAFWFVRVENILELFWGLYRAGQFPIYAFPGWVRVIFTFIVPIAFITTVPSEAIIGRVSATNVLGSFVVATVLMVAARALWRFALRSYTSASS